ncbi:hypothetical protein ILUMI_03146 [Ignelater luminosus]|uniref:Multiple inositol polyphosphate phosphatase 1 n=1 Tax=Ignelater luminosus TaxID=2038154 RepID=A0A8K0DF55_IGNLU|nr:hypothetical protein ILUMI_03146 [Ignelater luminosus]
MLSLNFLCVFITIFGFVYSIEECKNVSEIYKFHLGTKTPYRFVANTMPERMDYPGCEPQKLWFLVRHGTRTPSIDLIENMKERLPEIRDLILENNPKPSERLRNSDLYALRKWKLKIDSTKEKILAHEGEDEMIDLAERLQMRFPSLLPSTYSNTTYYFKYTKSQRTKASAKYFAAGLFGRQSVRDVWYPTPSKKDPVLRFYKLCSKWKDEVKDNPESVREKQLFENSSHMLKAIEAMNYELKFKDNQRLSLEDVHLIYMTCAFETAWYRKNKSPWCSALTSEVAKVMEFTEDLKYYYRDGYGYEITYKQACVTFNDMLNHLESTSQYPKSTVYYTHSGTLLKMLSHMGLYNDSKPLTHKDFDQSGNKWRVSKIDSFGTNLGFILYRCDQKYKVLTLHQEHVVHLPSCEEELCDLDQIKEHYNDSIHECEFDEMCSNNENDL